MTWPLWFAIVGLQIVGLNIDWHLFGVMRRWGKAKPVVEPDWSHTLPAWIVVEDGKEAGDV